MFFTHLAPHILIPPAIVHIGNRHKIGHGFMMWSTNWKYECITFISNNWETAMTWQGHVTTASLKQANREYIKGHFLSACHPKSSAHPSLKLHTVKWGTINGRMSKFAHDQTNSHGVIIGSFGVEECWSYINIAILSSMQLITS